AEGGVALRADRRRDEDAALVDDRAGERDPGNCGLEADVVAGGDIPGRRGALSVADAGGTGAAELTPRLRAARGRRTHQRLGWRRRSRQFADLTGLRGRQEQRLAA